MKSDSLVPVRFRDLLAGLFYNFRHLFGSVKEREWRDTVALYESTKATYEASSASDFKEADQLLLTLVIDTCTQPERPAHALCFPFYETARELLAHEELLFGFPEIDVNKQLRLDDEVWLRNYLRKKAHFLAHEEKLSNIWFEKIIRIFNGILNYIPEGALPPDHMIDTDELTFHTPLLDSLENPAEAIERIVVTMFDDDIVDAVLLEPTRNRIDSNALLASGITPDIEDRTTRRVILPTEMKGKSPRELVEMYLRGTPFTDLLRHELPFTIPTTSRFEHCHICGGTGHGKTQTLQSLIYDDLQCARDGACSVVVIDSQGDLIRTISHLEEFSPTTSNSLADRLLLIDPNDIEYPVCLNMFDVNRERIGGYEAVEREKILNGTIELYEYIFGALLGAEITQKQSVIFRYLARLMLIIPNATVQTLLQIMEDGKAFKPYMEKLDGTSRKFFETQFFHPSFNATKTQITRRLWGVLSNRSFERMFSHPENKVDLFEAMNSGKIILINTAKDLLKQEGSEILGRFFIAMIAQAALERATIPARDRLPVFVYIDEAHEYFDDTVELLLGQARKYNIGITMAHQTLDQASTGLRASMMANTSIKIAGGVSSKDARSFASEMRCDSDFVHGMQKRARETEFACWVKHVTPSAIKISVPLGRVEALPTIAEEDYTELIERNRKHYAAPIAELQEFETNAVSPAPPITDIEVERGETSPSPRPKPERAEPRKRPSIKPTDAPQQMGRGGPDHKYLQHLVKGHAEQRGYRATIEESILDGSGRVDVSLIKGDQSIACEISITTMPEHELLNIKKCLAADYDAIFVIAEAPKHRVRPVKGVDQTG